MFVSQEPIADYLCGVLSALVAAEEVRGGRNVREWSDVLVVEQLCG